MPEPTFTERQQNALDHLLRKGTYDFLTSEDDKAATLGELAEAIEVSDLAIAHYHLNRLVEVDLVEKVWGTNFYRAVQK